MRRLIVGSLFATLLGAAAFAAAARTSVDFYLNFGPPPVRYEVVPAPRAGFIWIPGYWDWRANRHYWVAGHWLRHRPGYHYETARWVEHGGRWAYYRGGWRGGDRDRDGIPNRYDRAPDNPHRR